MRIVAIVQARMSSTRLPGKVLLPLNDRPVLEHLCERLANADIDEIIIATSDDQSDDVIHEYCKQLGVACFRGDLHNVLSRYYYAAAKSNADAIVRITSDCPMYDYSVLNEMIQLFDDCDFMSNCISRTFPRGLDTEIFTFSALKKAYNFATTHFEKEHVTPYIINNDSFIKKSYKGLVDNSKHRWTLDTSADYLMIKTIFNDLGDNFDTSDALNYLEKKPEVFSINQHVVQKTQ